MVTISAAKYKQLAHWQWERRYVGKSPNKQGKDSKKRVVDEIDSDSSSEGTESEVKSDDRTLRLRQPAKPGKHLRNSSEIMC